MNTHNPLLPHNNLPLQLTSFVGREREVAAILELLRRDDVRLLTLTGAPGIGKTRLAIQVATGLLPDFADGAFFVNLAPITDPSLVVSAIVYSLGVRQTGNQSLLWSLKHFLAEKQVLLVLDNFEQVLDAAPQVTEVLQAATGLKVLVTSRELLRLSGEHNFPVPPLALPPVLSDQGSVRALAHLSSESIGEYTSVQLFAQRARALKPDFALTESNALTVAGICSRLDGLPLPIELAAARIKHLPPQAVLDRLQNRLQLLTGGTQDLHPRQRTLRATIDWSYNLLNEEEQRLFRRLSVFQGGCTLEALEAVCNADGDLGIDVMDGITSLVDKSLVQMWTVEFGVPTDEGSPDQTSDSLYSSFSNPHLVEPYYAMLETIHEYAREQLIASGEAESLRRYHASYFLALAQKAEPELRGPRQADWLDRLERDLANLRAVLDWAYHRDIALGLQLAAVLGTFWIRRGHLVEGQERLSQMLLAARDGEMPPTGALARALYAGGMVAWHQGDFPAARFYLEGSVRVMKELQAEGVTADRGVLAESLSVLGIVVGRLDGVPARRSLQEEALEVARETGDRWTEARSLFQLGHAARLAGDYVLAERLFDESLALFRALGDVYNIGLALIGAGLMAQQRGDYEAARSYYEESLGMNRGLGVPWAVASALYCLGSVALDQGDYASARSFLNESLVAQRGLGTRGDTAEGLENLGRAAYFQGDYLAAASHYREGLALFEEVSDRYGMALCLMDLGGVFIAVGKALRASSGPGTRQANKHGRGEESGSPLAVSGVQLLGAAQSLFESIGFELNQMGRKLFDIYVADAREQLGDRAFTEASGAGQAMDVESAVSLANSIAIPQGWDAARAGDKQSNVHPEPTSQQIQNPGALRATKIENPLTRRERDIAALIGQGKSNRQIADELIMSERTVEWHASNILSKLGIQSRSQIAVWAVEQGLTRSS